MAVSMLHNVGIRNNIPIPDMNNVNIVNDDADDIEDGPAGVNGGRGWEVRIRLVLDAFKLYDVLYIYREFAIGCYKARLLFIISVN